MQSEGTPQAVEYAYDPRYLVFEFIFDLILRKVCILPVELNRN
jgi:hypothetical protein